MTSVFLDPNNADIVQESITPLECPAACSGDEYKFLFERTRGKCPV
jgi:hypothetical protein